MLHDSAVQAALDQVWPDLTPQQLLADLFSSAERIASAASSPTPGEQRLLPRAPDAGWTPSDVPLLDEAAELHGQDDRVERAREEREHRERVAYAQGVLDIAHGSRPTDLEDGQEAEVLSVSDTFDTVRAALAGMPRLPCLPPDADTAEPFPLPVAGRWANPSGRAPQEAGVVLYVHGGGFEQRRPEFEDLIACHVSKAAGRPAVFTVDYSLAPARPFPAACDEVTATYRALLAQDVPAERTGPVR